MAQGWNTLFKRQIRRFDPPHLYLRGSLNDVKSETLENLFESRGDSIAIWTNGFLVVVFFPPDSSLTFKNFILLNDQASPVRCLAEIKFS